ncbi:hypothetical protein F2Q69_00010695 [Brassica cretica]|uniref:Uncharacterized protein n=1 Tax=Brassica cretica TaxID=69181 RepID=A0A8S9R465_BRACR|nr:hypothetical protein F2Q69_00010695 [Brassica cretica]
MYNRKPMAKNKQAMDDDDAVDPNMSFKNIMKDVQHFAIKHMTWKDKKALENQKVTELGGKNRAEMILLITNSVGRTPIDSNQNMYNRKPMAKNKQAMDDDAVDPNMSFKNIMKDVQHFAIKHMTWKDKKALENQKVTELGGKSIFVINSPFDSTFTRLSPPEQSHPPAIISFPAISSGPQTCSAGQFYPSHGFPASSSTSLSTTSIHGSLSLSHGGPFRILVV